ncbi:MAG: IS110 family transposase [Candidatus Heimdallarchaeota archaeon]|nr:IS110 family transposase [Candidatus Heimdallarchaeota archaeon]
MVMAKKRKTKSKSVKMLHIIKANAAGIDIGASEIYIAVPDDRDNKPIRHFDTFTADLHEAAKWLKACGIDSIAMESTGVYWIPVFQIFESYGFDVVLVNARHVKNVPGRKTDVQDCQWLQYLHSVGLLRGSYRPPQEICAVRSLLRHRDGLVRTAASHIQHMQKSLTQMNLQIHNVISDITGVTGLTILDAILSGERDPKKLAALKNGRIKASKTTIEKSLQGDYLPEHVFTLKQSLQAYRHYQQMMAECDQEIENHLNNIDSRIDVDKNPPPPPTSSPRRGQGNEPNFDLRTHMFRILGTDLTKIEGISAVTAHVFFSEVGYDVSKFPNAGNFSSWLNLCPGNKISGGKVLSSHTLPGKNRLAKALQMSAMSLWRSQSYLGNYYRRKRAKDGAPSAITDTAHKLARIIYHLVKTGKQFDESIFNTQEEAHQKRVFRSLANKAKKMGFQLVP